MRILLYNALETHRIAGFDKVRQALERDDVCSGNSSAR